MEAFWSAMAALVLALASAVPVVVKLWHRDQETDARVDRLWEAHMLRGVAETTNKRLGVPVSDPQTLLLRPEILLAYEPIAPALKALRKTMPNATAGQFAEAVEARFGRWLSTHICLVIGVSDFACLAMAKIIADRNGSDRQCPDEPKPTK